MVVEKAGFVALRSVADGIREVMRVVSRSSRSVENLRVLERIADIGDCLAGHLSDVESLAEAVYDDRSIGGRLPGQKKSRTGRDVCDSGGRMPVSPARVRPNVAAGGVRVSASGAAVTLVRRAMKSFDARMKAKDLGGGVWRTTDDGSKIFIAGDGEIRGGGPSGPVLTPAPAKESPEKTTEKRVRKKTEIDPSSPFVPRTKVDQAIVDFIGDDRRMVEAFRVHVDEAYEMRYRKIMDDRDAALNLLAQFGLKGTKVAPFISSLRHKRDHTNIAGFDEMTEYAQKYHPEMLTAETGESYGKSDGEQALFNRLRGGFPSPPAKFSDEVLNLAAEMAGPAFFAGSAQSEYDRQMEAEYADVDF